MCGTKCGSALHPAGSLLQRFLARPKSASGARRRHFLGGSGGAGAPPGEGRVGVRRKPLQNAASRVQR
eukprot:8781585-Alexandrium_andersonii.AAC.1